MSVGRAFRKVTRAIRRLERADWRVERATGVEHSGLVRQGDVRLQLRCWQRHQSPDRGKPTSHGGAGPAVVGELRDLGDELTVAVEEFRVEATASTLTLRIEVPGEPAEERREPDLATGRTDPPLHRDVNRLAGLYAEHRTFQEMAEAVDQDISEETVRRYMIEHDIHDPGTDSTDTAEWTRAAATEASDAETDEPVLATDGIGYPAPVDRESLVEAICTARTPRELANRLGTERDTAVSILSDLGLLEELMGRVDRSPDRRLSRDEVEARLEAAK